MLCILLLCTPAWPQLEEKYALWINNVGKSRWFTYHLDPQDVLRLKDKWAQIEESLKTDSNEFAGQYFQYGYMSGHFLIWSPSGGFVYVRYFDVEHPCYFTYGKIKSVAEEVHFQIEYESKNSICPGRGKTPLRWIPAGNGEYFIPVTQARRFGEFYAGRGEFNGYFQKWKEEFPFPLRWQKEFVPKTKFVLPAGYQKFVRKSIEAQIIWVGKKRVAKYKPIFGPFWDKSSLTPIRINVGRKHGVVVGQEFVLLDQNDADAQTLRITNVAESHCSGVVVRQVDEDGIEGFFSYDEKAEKFITKPFSQIAVGLRVTTSPIRKLF
ncbi:MAG TPA: hypothetical protein VFZ23_09165 [Pyrinomonadaceae bacterium]